MKPDIGDYVKIFLKNSLQVEGKVYSWDDKIVLSSEDNSSFMVIKNAKHIIMYKLIKEENISLEKELEKTTEDQNLFLEDSQEINSGELNDPLKLKKLADLHKLKIEEEKKIVAQRLKEHHIGEVKGVKYDLPGFFKK